MQSDPPTAHGTSQDGRNLRPVCTVAVCAALALFVASCASSKKNADSGYTNLSLGQRIVKQTNDPRSIKSRFQEEVFDAKHSVATSDFKAGDYKGGKSFSRAGDRFKTGSFAQSDKASSAADKAYAGAEEQSQWAGSSYKTSESRYDGQLNRASGQSSALGNKTFKTDSNPAALRNTSNIKQPLIENGPSYTEDDVKKMLNKG